MDANIDSGSRTKKGYFWVDFVDNIFPDEKYINTTSLRWIIEWFSLTCIAWHFG